MINKYKYPELDTGLPEFPFWLGVKDEVVERADIRLFLNSKEELSGSLIEINFFQNFLLIQENQSDIDKKIYFHELGVMHFSKSYSFDLNEIDPVFTGPGVILPNHNKPYNIHLKNDSIAEGEMKAFVVNDSGIHIFKDIDNMLERIFIPHASVLKSKLGNKIGEDLLEKNLVKAKYVSEALYEQTVYKSQKVGEYLLDQNVIDENELTQVLKIQQSLRQKKNINIKIGDLLVHEKIVNKSQLDNAIDTYFDNKNSKIGDILIKSGHVSDIKIHNFLSNNFGIPLVNISEFNVNKSVIKYLPYKIAKKYYALPLEKFDNRILVTFYDPLDQKAISEIKKISGQKIEIVTSTKAEILEAFKSYYGSFVINDNFEKLEKYHFDSLKKINKFDDLEDRAINIANAKPVINLVDSILHDALVKGTSKIVLKPYESKIKLFYKQGAILKKLRSFHKALLQLILTRIKTIANMDLLSCDISQYGVASFDIANTTVDLRISILPTLMGESVVIHLINPSISSINFDVLGLKKKDSTKFMDILVNNKGLILVAGPENSDKTKTLYAAINELLHNNINTLTIEDPVKCHIHGAEQIQLSSVKNISYTQTMSHLLEHDPDAIMIGEICDRESAKVVLESSLLNYIVLSSIKAEDAFEAIMRLIEIDEKTYRFSDILSGVFAQRLVQKNCENCLIVEDIDEAIYKSMDIDPEVEFYVGSGCESCNGTGFKNKIMVYELLELTNKLRKYLSKDMNITEFKKHAIDEGMVTLKMKLVMLAREKIISLKEAFLVNVEYSK